MISLTENTKVLFKHIAEYPCGCVYIRQFELCVNKIEEEMKYCREHQNEYQALMDRYQVLKGD